MTPSFAVVDLGFGDSGKGLLTDALVRRHDARVVVRTNGGAQAGHRVVAPDGRAHVFSQVGAGSFVPGVRTVLARTTLVDPLALAVEVDRLAAIGVVDIYERLTVEAGARLVTPWHAALNRARERERGDTRHGSCGVGVGETVAADVRWPELTLHAGDLAEPTLARRARELMDALGATGVPLGEESAWFSRTIAARWAERARWLAPHVEEDAGVLLDGPVVFEGAQGVLLDEDHGFAPYTTRSRCDLREVDAAAARWGLRPVRLGVLRAHAHRHGAGPLPTVDPAVSPAHDHNHANPWQGAVRYGPFDLVLARYARAAVGALDGLVFTHLDTWEPRLAVAYDIDGERVDALPAPGDRPTQTRLGARLTRARPRYERLSDRQAWIRRVEAELDVAVIALSEAPNGLVLP